MRDRSLDEFADADTGSAGDSDAAGDDPTGADEGAAVTYEWTPGGAACGTCGASVEARWRDGEAFVCADCKEW